MGHTRVHTKLPGTLADSNEPANKLTKMVTLSQVELAQQSHVLQHQNNKSLRKQFSLTSEIDHQIVQQYVICITVFTCA